MNSIVKYIFLFFLLVLSTVSSAQNISVASFKLLENDLTANTAGTMERDPNGEIAALIKVVTTEQGFVFDGGMTGIVKTKQEVGEVWVYVPHGIKKMTIKHPQLGVLRDYYFPSTIDKAKTYEMVLATGKVETIVTHSVNKQFVVFNVKPVDAIVELDDEMLTVDSEGYATKSVTYGKYNYRVSCANYHTEAGQVTVNAQGKAEVNVTLRPNFGWIRFEGAEELHGAHVYIDNERVGQLPLTTKELKSGVHQIRIVKELYKVYEQQITVSDNETIIHEVKMKPNFAKVTLIAADGGEIWIDGQKKAVTQWTGALEKGDYTVEVKKASHRSSSEVVHITELETRTLQLKAPTPIYGSLEITSTPANATIILDGKNVGKTPMLMSDILVGMHGIVLEKDGYVATEKNIEVKEHNDNLVSSKLSKRSMASLSEKDMGAYLMVYHKDADHGLHMAISYDGYEFISLNEDKPLFAGDTIAEQKGIRDPHIFRGPDGAFYLAMTDLHLFGVRDGYRTTEWERDGRMYGWGNNRGLVLMKSTDLKHWTRTNLNFQKMGGQWAEVGCVWAPETCYDYEKGKLFLHFTTRFGNGRNMIYYVYMNDDFTAMESEPQLLFEAPQGKYNVIDSDIMYHDGTYHLFYVSHEGGATVKHATAADIKGPYTMDENYYDGVRQGHEAPNCWKRIGEDTWVVMHDNYRINPHNFGFTETHDFIHYTPIGNFDEGKMQRIGFSEQKHGAVIQITKEEAYGLEEQWKKVIKKKRRL